MIKLSRKQRKDGLTKEQRLEEDVSDMDILITLFHKHLESKFEVYRIVSGRSKANAKSYLSLNNIK